MVDTTSSCSRHSPDERRLERYTHDHTESAQKQRDERHPSFLRASGDGINEDAETKESSQNPDRVAWEFGGNEIDHVRYLEDDDSGQQVDERCQHATDSQRTRKDPMRAAPRVMAE